ncbi:amidohydrolase family protein [Natrialba sp. INN-245]|uniref:amidohydrolase family protein n=1 Tax=Natrialba sp. INN-245 TaxID=2690967 RepID=UPI001312EAF9|nr:amidohydrolase family protein [Natrialba sp. INN-245]MWV40595.1 amidohydrolase family protein [Natrialba sp. INN-245]
MTIRETIETTALIDNHAHPVEPLSETDVRERFARWFTEGDLEYRDARHTFNYRAALGVLAERFDVDAGPGDDAFERELLESRATVDRHEYTRDCIASTNTDVILTDDGFPDTSPAEFREYTDADVYPLLRLEALAESLIDDHAEFGAFEDALVDRMESALEGEYVALKTIVAYRRGLNVGTADRADARAAFADVRSGWDGRLEHPRLLDYVIHRACEVAADYDAPIQFHAGFGDPDAHPRYVDPTHLVACIEAHPETSIVVLHGAYPYVGQAGYVTATYPNVYLDLSLAVPFAQHGSERVVSTAMELAPTTKLLYGSDGFSVPELYVLAARRFRDALASTLEGAVADGIVTESYAETVAENVLRENALGLYDL